MFHLTASVCDIGTSPQDCHLFGWITHTAVKACDLMSNLLIHKALRICPNTS